MMMSFLQVTVDIPETFLNVKDSTVHHKSDNYYSLTTFSDTIQIS